VSRPKIKNYKAMNITLDVGVIDRLGELAVRSRRSRTAVIEDLVDAAYSGMRIETEPAHRATDEAHGGEAYGPKKIIRPASAAPPSGTAATRKPASSGAGPVKRRKAS
jgi:predicted transcriptional regulator